MTEAEWLRLHTGMMLLHLEQTNSISPRKLRLLAVAYARIIETQPEYVEAKPVVHLGEEVAEGRATLESLLDPDVRGWGVSGHWGIAHLVLAQDGQIGRAIRRIMSVIMGDDSSAEGTAAERKSEVLRPYIRCVVGNPFRPVSIDPLWLTSDVLGLARGIYEERAFDRLPILADALMDAGCDNDDILTHCRSEGPHVRGCWVVDLILGKE
jgi:hypothetical protein